MKTTYFNSARIFTLLMFLAFTTILTSCNEDKNELSGEFEVEMTDSKGDYARVDVEITKVEIYNDNGTWFDLENNSYVYTVTDLTNGNKVSIGSRTDLEVGHYTKVRLTIGGNSSISAALGGNLVSFNSVSNNSIEIEIDYTLEAETKQTALIDFHVGESINETLTGFDLSPVVTWVRNQNTGVQGSFEANTRGWIQLTNSTGAKFDAYTDSQGRFFIQGMAAGSYTAEAYPASLSGFATVTTVTNVQVSNGEITSMGTVDLQ